MAGELKQIDQLLEKVSEMPKPCPNKCGDCPRCEKAAKALDKVQDMQEAIPTFGDVFKQMDDLQQWISQATTGQIPNVTLDDFEGLEDRLKDLVKQTRDYIDLH